MVVVICKARISQRSYSDTRCLISHGRYTGCFKVRENPSHIHLLSPYLGTIFLATTVLPHSRLPTAQISSLEWPQLRSLRGQAVGSSPGGRGCEDTNSHIYKLEVTLNSEEIFNWIYQSQLLNLGKALSKRHRPALRSPRSVRELWLISILVCCAHTRSWS